MENKYGENAHIGLNVVMGKFFLLYYFLYKLL